MESHQRRTIQQQAVLDAVRELNIHATAEQIYEYVVRRYPTVSKATVYRNLNRMAETGELLNIGSFYGSVHYDHNCHPHYHFLCRECQRVFDVNHYFPGLNTAPEEMDDGLNGFEIMGHTLTFNGICSDCSSNNSERNG